MLSRRPPLPSLCTVLDAAPESREYLVAQLEEGGPPHPNLPPPSPSLSLCTVLDAPESTEDLVAQLEAQAGGGGGEDIAGDAAVGGDMGSRGGRQTAHQRTAAAELIAAADKRARFAAALEKSNWASQV